MRPRCRLVRSPLLVWLALPCALAGQVWEVDNVALGLPAPQDWANFGSAVAIGDFDGDGIADLAVGAVGWDSPTVEDAGGWRIFWGSSDRALAAAGGVFSFGVVGPVEAGGALAAGDFDGDGRDELAIGAPATGVGQAEQAGVVVIAKYDVDLETWPAPSLELSQEDVPLTDPVDYEFFGARLAVGDFNADGRDDLAVGAPYNRWPGYLDTGAAHVFYGDAAQLLRTDNAITLLPPDLSNAGLLGAALAAGDFDGDGDDDLAIGAPRRDVAGQADAGAVEIHLGSASGLSTLSAQTIDDADFPESAVASSENFGGSLAVANLDELPATCGVLGLCSDDLAIGVPGQELEGWPRAGKVMIVYGSAAGLDTSTFKALTPASVGEVAEAFDEFGYALAGGRLDPDSERRAGLAIGSPFEDWGALGDGVAHLVVPGGPGSASPLSSQSLAQRSGLAIAPAGDDERFGWELAIGDLDGDGWGDLVVAVPGEGSGHSGAVQVLYGALFADGFGVGTTNGWLP